jgi:hypothetical protein
MRFIVAALAVCVLFATPRAASAANFDPNYAPALAAVNGFLFAWSRRDMDAGMAYVSPELVHAIGAPKIRAYISGTSSPSHAAFEIGQGSKGAGGMLIFPIRLVWALQGVTSGIDSRLIRTQENGGKWQVVSLPYATPRGRR